MDINKKKSLDNRLKNLHNALLFQKYYQTNSSTEVNSLNKKTINNGNINIDPDIYYHTQTLVKPQMWKYKAFMPTNTPNMAYLQ